MNILIVSDGSPDSQSALAYGIGKALETRGELTVVHVYQRREGSCEQALQHSLQCFDAVRASVHDHGSGVSAKAMFMTINDHRDILTYAATAQIDLIVAPPAYDALFGSACCLVDIVTSDDRQTAVL